MIQGSKAIDFSTLSKERLEAMAAAGDEVVDCIRVLAKTGDNLVAEVLRDEGDFVQWNHYPAGDVYDFESGGQYYYHAHPPEERGGEHGHFHTFMRPKGMPSGVAPAPLADFVAPEEPDDALSHLVAISMDKYGLPIGLFTTNRWVTGEIWYAAPDVIAMLDGFVVDLARPASWPVNRWIGAMVALFRPQIELLVRRRDAALAEWRPKVAGASPYEDRALEVTSEMRISVDEQVAAIAAALRRK